MKTRKIAIILVLLVVLAGVLIGVAYASFNDTSKFESSRFSVGSVDLKLLNDLAGGNDSSNLVDTKPAPSYDNISSLWTQDYLIKIFNNGSQTLTLTSNMDYETANDPGNIREILYMEPFEWDDANNNGIVDDESEIGNSYSKKAFTSWKSTGFDFGQLAQGDVKALIMRFSAGNVTNSKMGQVGVFDFVFDSVGL